MSFIALPMAAIWYRAHNAGIVSAYLRIAVAPSWSRCPRFLLNVATVRVLYAHALMAPPGLALGRFASLGRMLGDPD